MYANDVGKEVNARKSVCMLCVKRRRGVRVLSRLERFLSLTDPAGRVRPSFGIREC